MIHSLILYVAVFNHNIIINDLSNNLTLLKNEKLNLSQNNIKKKAKS